ncbi:DUF4350 domain-containing protein [Salegentibacter chungangensis]|uniref:DUF4350 domain-containing protein n=1 Tax=Salegentibacter chungangensis TaxID=1335724 RepID=A0ABW3NT50_9FLAO
MKKTYKIMFSVFLIFTLLLTYLEATEPEPVNWAPSYTSTDKIPLGAYVFFESWNETGSTKIEQVKIPPYEFLTGAEEPEGTYFFLNNSLSFDKDEFKRLLSWIEKGNTAFIAADYFGGNLLDSLNIETSNYLDKEDFSSRPQLNLVHPELKRDSTYNFKEDMPARYFSNLDSLEYDLLGTIDFKDNKEEKVNFIRTRFGNGYLYLHTTPQAFSNYFLLRDNNWEYSQKVLAYLDKDRKLYWDTYYKSGKTYFSSPLYVLLNHRELKWAYYIFILGSVLFILFEGKRKQRAIPVIEPLKNQTYDYTETIAGLYLEQGRYKELAVKKIDLFLDYIRTRYRVQTGEFKEEFYLQLAQASGNSPEHTKELFERILNFKQATSISREEFHELSRDLNKYKKASNG